MKTTTTILRYLFVIVAAIAAAILPINILAAPGDLFVSDPYAGTISKFTPDGTKTTFASGLPYATGLAFDASGNLFVDVLLPGGDGATILKFTPNGTKSTFAQTGLRGGGSLAFDASGNLFVADEPNGIIFKFTPGGTKSTFASGLHTPIGLAFDSSGNLFEADNGFGAIFRFTPDGTRTTFAAGLSSPWGLAFGASGDLFQVSNPDGAIYVFTPGGTPKSIFASGLNGPTFLAFDASGNLFVADYGVGTIFKFTSGGTKSTFATGVTNVQGLAFEPTILSPGAALRNFSTRASVQTGQGVTIAGFIITGTDSKSVVVRGLGSTLAQPPFNVQGVLADPTLQLFDSGGHPFWFNDNWKDTQQAQIQATGLAPPNDLESGILQILQPGNYTAILSGKNGTTGVALVEVYDINPGTSAELTNVSTRGFVGTGDNMLIAGFISNGSTQVVVRGLGPTLAQPQFGVSGALADPVVTLVDSDGNVVATNDNWKNTQQAEISATGKAPPNDLEAAILAPVAAGNYTAILSGNGGGTGIGLVEVYKLP